MRRTFSPGTSGKGRQFGSRAYQPPLLLLALVPSCSSTGAVVQRPSNQVRGRGRTVLVV